MSLDNYKFRYDAYKNNTFDLEIVEKTLEESKMSAYQYLREFQLISTGYKRFDFKMQEIYRTNKVNHNTTLVPRRWVFYLEHEFINVGKRLDYKRSKFYEKDLSFDDIISRPDLFDSTFLVFVDGLLYTKGIQVLCKEDKTYLIFTCKEQPSPDGFTITEMREYLTNNVNVSIFFIPNTGIKNIATNAYRLRSMNSSTGVPNRTLNLTERVDYNNSLAFINPKDTIFSLPTNANITDSGLYVDNEAVDFIIKTSPNNTALNIQLIPLRNLLTKLYTGKGNKWFEIPMQDYPVAVENCMVFDDEGTFIHNAVVNHYYPNVYSIEGVDDIVEEKELTIYVFYYENKQNKLKHLDMLYSYHKYVPDYLQKYQDGTISDYVKNFEPPQVDYSIKDFKNFEHYDDHFRYKISKMKEFIQADVNNFRRYLRNLGLGNNYYYVDVSKIDLESRRRSNNSDTKLAYKEFDQDMYMFVFRNDFRGMYDSLMVHVDGLRHETVELYRGDMLDFLYVPCDIVNEDTVIEIEKLTDVIREFKFSSQLKTDIISIDIGDFPVRNKTLYNDLFLVDKETNEYIDPSCYQIILPVKIYLEDSESHIVLDYIISESNKSYYYLKGLENGILELVKEENVDDDNEAFYLRALDNEAEKAYQFDVVNDTNITFDEIDDYANIISRVKSMDNEGVSYHFKVVDGVVQIEVELAENSAGINSKGVIAFGGLDIIDLGDVFLPCSRKIQIRITDENYLNRDLLLMIKKNFNIESLERQEDEELFQSIKFVTASKNDPRYFRIYRNGRLIPRHLATVKFPIDYNYSEMDVFPGFERTVDDLVMVECMPYMMTQTCYLEEIPNDKVIDLTGLIDKPFDFKWYDIYLNGRKLVKKDVEIISANRIKILKTKSLKWLEIVENSRDKEYFGYKPVYDILDFLYENDEDFANNVNNSIITDDMQDIEEPVIDKPINFLNYILRKFYDEFLFKNFGLINPDLLQISKYDISAYNEILSDSHPFELNADTYGQVNCDLILPVNPDDIR